MHPLYEKANALAIDVFDAVLEVKKHFGTGVMLEKVYQKCLSRELEMRGHKVDLEAEVPIKYKGYTFEEKLRIDLLVDKTLVVECKAVDPEKVNTDRFRAQALTYLKLMDLPLALVVNFGGDCAGKKGISRVILKGADSLGTLARTQGDSKG